MYTLFIRREILNGGKHELNVLAEETYPTVAVNAQKTAHFPSVVMFMIHDEVSSVAADLAAASLVLVHPLIFIQRHVVASLQDTGVHLVSIGLLPPPIPSKVSVVVSLTPGAKLLTVFLGVGFSPPLTGIALALQALLVIAIPCGFVPADLRKRLLKAAFGACLHVYPAQQG